MWPLSLKQPSQYNSARKLSSTTTRGWEKEGQQTPGEELLVAHLQATRGASVRHVRGEEWGGARGLRACQVFRCTVPFRAKTRFPPASMSCALIR